MAILHAFEYGKQHSNVSHFAAMARLALVDGAINEKETRLLLRMAEKLSISDEAVKQIMKDPSKFPLDPINSREERLERLYDLFRIIYSDHDIDEDESNLIHKYAIGLGCTHQRAKEVIKRSIKIFGGNIGLDDYLLLLDRD